MYSVMFLTISLLWFRFNEQLAKDQNGAICPDVNTPFKSKEDAWHRLMKFHVYNSQVPSVREIVKGND